MAAGQDRETGQGFMTEQGLAAERAEALETLRTPRDVLRFAISRFRAAGLVHGHGASRALDEAAFIILETLHLPVDQLEPFLDAQLLPGERARLIDLVARRIVTRKPAAYLLGCTYLNGERFIVDERVIVPRSFIAELFRSPELIGEDGLMTGISPIESVLDLCTGSGCLAILAAKLTGAPVDAVDLSGQALAVARQNVALHGLEDSVQVLEGDLYAPLPKGRRYDLIVSNPPYVDKDAMAALPPEYRAEPAMALDGGSEGIDIVRRIIEGAGDRLTPGGAILVEVGSQRERVEAAFPDLPFLWLDTEESAGEVFWLAAADLA